MTRRRTTGTLPPAHGEPARDEDTFRLRVPPPRVRPAPAPPFGPSGRLPVPAGSRSPVPGGGAVAGATAAEPAAGSLAGRAGARGGGGRGVSRRPPLAPRGRPGRRGPRLPSRTAPETGPDNASKPLEDAPDPTPPPTPTPTPSASADTDASREGDALGPEDIPASGPGTFTVARAGVTSTGRGSAYRVEVEDGIGVDPDRAAADIAAVLADPRGWSHGGERSFRQVSDGSAGLVIRSRRRRPRTGCAGSTA